MASTALQKKVGFATFCSSPAVRTNISNVVGEKNTQQFIASIVSAVQANKELAECTNSSIFSAALLGQSLQLSPSPQLGQYYIVPYKNRRSGVSEATFQLGAKGYKQLAIRSGQYRKLVTSVVKEGELKSFNPITEEYVFEPVTDVAVREKLPVIGYYAMLQLTNGFTKEIYWPKEKMVEHATRYSQGYKQDLQKNTAYTFWSKDFDGMAEKTMIRQLISKWGIMSVEMERAYQSDMGVLNESGEVKYVDNPQEDIAAQVEEDIKENANASEIVIEVEAEDIPK